MNEEICYCFMITEIASVIFLYLLCILSLALEVTHIIHHVSCEWDFFLSHVCFCVIFSLINVLVLHEHIFNFHRILLYIHCEMLNKKKRYTTTKTLMTHQRIQLFLIFKVFKVDLSLLFSKQNCFYLIILDFSIFILVNDL